MGDDEERLPRRLSAILLADMKDYSALMGEDEAYAIAGVDEVGASFAAVVPRHGGTYEISSGDRFFAVFDSAVEAFEAAVEIQAALAALPTRDGRTIAIRMGLHLGEVVRTPFGLMGDAINVAARLQEIAEPGGIAVSGDVHRAVRNRAQHVTFLDLGPRMLKNISEPVPVFAVERRPAGAAGGRPRAAERTPAARLAGHRSRRAVVGGAIGLAAGVAAWRWGHGVREWIARQVPRIEPAKPLVLGVMRVQTHGELPVWMSDLTRDGLNTVLSKQPALQVYSRQKIDFLREKRDLSEIEVAEQLGITKMIAATLSGTPASMALEVQVIDIGTGLLERSYEARGSEPELIQMQNDAALDVLRSFKVPVDEEVTRLLSRRTNDRLADYKLLTESMGGNVVDAPADREPHSRPLPFDLPGTARAWAAADEAAIQGLLDRYQAALESKNLASVQAIHVALPDPMRDALAKYFANANELRVRFSKVDIVVEGDEALATFTRTDDFTDASSGLPVHLEVRVSNVVARENGAWKIRGLKRSD